MGAPWVTWASIMGVLTAFPGATTAFWPAWVEPRLKLLRALLITFPLLEGETFTPRATVVKTGITLVAPLGEDLKITPLGLHQE